MKAWLTLLQTCTLSLCLLCLQTAQATPYSNIIIFGDSQSDIGNFPESGNAGLAIPLALNGMPYNLYVPFSNPIDTSTQPGLPSQPAINGQFKRDGRSLNWTQYLFAALKKNAQVQSSILLPWSSIQSYQPQSDFFSVDYAVGGALSDDDCANQSYQPMSDGLCNTSDFLNTAQHYRNNPRQFKLRDLIPIPGTQRQVDFFAQDLKTGKVKVNSKTLYLVFTGANDLSASFRVLLHGGSLANFYQTITQVIPGLIAGTNHSIIQRLAALDAKHIIIIGMQNLALTPEASVRTGLHNSKFGRYLNAYLLNFLVLRYNLSLAEDIVAIQKQYPDVSIQLINTQMPLNRISMLPGSPFLETLGEACQNHNTATYTAILQGKVVNCDHYLYWNGAHLSNVGNMYFARIILDHLH